MVEVVALGPAIQDRYSAFWNPHRWLRLLPHHKHQWLGCRGSARRVDRHAADESVASHRPTGPPLSAASDRRTPRGLRLSASTLSVCSVAALTTGCCRDACAGSAATANVASSASATPSAVKAPQPPPESESRLILSNDSAPHKRSMHRGRRSEKSGAGMGGGGEHEQQKGHM